MKNYMIDAFELKRKGYYKQAIELYYKVMSTEGDDIEILAELADLYFLLGNNERAMHYAEKALEIDENHASSLSVLRKVYLSDKNFDDAERIAKQIYSLTESETDLLELVKILEYRKKYDEIVLYTQNIEDIECKYKYALALYNLKQFDKAIDVLNNIVPDNLQTDYKEKVYELTGKIYYEQKNMDKAKEVFKKLEENNAENAESLNYIGLNKLDELKLDEAIEYFKSASEKDSKNPQYYFNMGQAYYLKGWFDEAKKSFNTAICLNPMDESYHYSLAYLLYRSGDYENAEAHLNPEYFDSKVLLQVIKAEKGDLATPKIELEKLLKEHPENELILSSLARIYFNLDMYKQAETIIKQAIELNSKSFEYQSFLVRIMLKLKQYDEANNKVKELVEKYPNYYYAKVLEAELNLEKKDYDALFDSAQDLIELDINHYEGYYYNACALFEKEDVNFAIESLKKAISLDVANAELYVKMSEFYQTIGKYEDAFEYIKEASDIDKSAKNKELYMQLASILRRKGIKDVSGK